MKETFFPPKKLHKVFQTKKMWLRLLFLFSSFICFIFSLFSLCLSEHHHYYYDDRFFFSSLSFSSLLMNYFYIYIHRKDQCQFFFVCWTLDIPLLNKGKYNTTFNAVFSLGKSLDSFVSIHVCVYFMTTSVVVSS